MSEPLIHPATDWLYDPGDPSVGIWPGWEHESCPVPADEAAEGVTEDSLRVDPADADGMAAFAYQLTCRDCGEHGTLMRFEYVGRDDETED